MTGRSVGLLHLALDQQQISDGPFAAVPGKPPRHLCRRGRCCPTGVCTVRVERPTGRISKSFVNHTVR